MLKVRPKFFMAAVLALFAAGMDGTYLAMSFQMITGILLVKILVEDN